MALTTISEIFNGSWGIVQKRRPEIEKGSHGVFDRIYKEELGRNFRSASVVAALMDCSETTARKWLRKVDARFIPEGNGVLYLASDALKAKCQRQAYLAEKEAKRKARKGNQ